MKGYTVPHLIVDIPGLEAYLRHLLLLDTVYPCGEGNLASDDGKLGPWGEELRPWGGELGPSYLKCF